MNKFLKCKNAYVNTDCITHIEFNEPGVIWIHINNSNTIYEFYGTAEDLWKAMGCVVNEKEIDISTEELDEYEKVLACCSADSYGVCRECPYYHLGSACRAKRNGISQRILHNYRVLTGK